MPRYRLVSWAILAIFWALFPFVVARAQAAAQTGTYTSAILGGDNVLHFTRFYLTGVTLPSGSSLTVEFSGNQSNFSTWSSPVAMNDSLDISNLAEVANSTQLKVRITLSTTGAASPTVAGMAVSYVEKTATKPPVDPNPAHYQAELVSQSASRVTVNAGDTVTLTASLKNTGSATWYKNYLSLGTVEPMDRCPGFDTVSGWYKCNRASFQEDSVAPGQTATFQMVWKVPTNKVATTFHEAYQPVADEITWLKDPKISWDVTVKASNAAAAGGPTIDPNPTHYAAQLVSQSATTATIHAGDTATFDIVLKNTGTATWYQDALSLGTISPSQDFVPGFDINLTDRSVDGWYKCNRVRFQESSVAPGQTATFHFRMTAPSNKLAGTYHYGFKPVVDEVAWLSDLGLGVTIVVN